MNNTDLRNKSLEYMNLVSHGDVLNTAKDDIVNTKLTILKNKEDLEILDKNIKQLADKDLSKLTDEEIENIFKKEDGTIIEVQNIYNDDLSGVRKEFLKFCVDGSKILEDIEKELDTLNEKIKESHKEIDNISVDFSEVFKKDIESRLEKLQSTDTTNMSEKQKRDLNKNINDCKKAIDIIEDSFTLNSLYENYVKIGVDSTIEDFYNRENSLRFYNKYKRFNKFYGIKTDLTKFIDLEKKFLSEKYHKYPNIFLFAVIKYYSYKPTYSFDKLNSVWLTQFNLNIYRLFKNKLNEEEKEKFLKNIERVLDLFINE